MSARRWAVLAVLIGVVTGLHGWGAMRWGFAVPAAREVGRPAAVRVVWRAPVPDAVPPSVEPQAVTEPAAPAPPVRPTRAACTAAAPPAIEAAPVAAPVEEAVSPPEPATVLAPDTLHAVAAAGPAAADTPASVPTYRTRIPPAASVTYRMSRSGLTGTGELDWRPEPANGGAYSLRLEGELPLVGTLITQTSRGRFDAAGLAPERYTDKRLRRGEQAANFRRAEGVVSFSGQSPDVPLSAGVQDRVSVMVQLAAIAAAWSKPPAVGTRLLVRVVGARGDANLWSLRFEGPDAVETPQGTVPALRFLREGDDPHDTRAEFWLDPARSHLPVRVRLSDGGKDPFELLRVK